jgi:short-subunit dehydrogenase
MGIGEAAARLLGKEGAKVVLAARSMDKLDAIAKEIPGSLAVECDMTKADDIENLFVETEKKFGRIDALVNNAGRGIYCFVEGVDVEAYRNVWDLNVVGPLIAMQKVIPLMRKNGGGVIVNISSMVSKNYFPRLGAYASTKYALNALSLTMRQEVAPDIVVSVVYPGLTSTDFGKNSVRSGEETRGMESRNRPNMPEADTPEHVATRILYALTSGEAEVYMHE